MFLPPLRNLCDITVYDALEVHLPTADLDNLEGSVAKTVCKREKPHT